MALPTTKTPWIPIRKTTPNESKSEYWFSSPGNGKEGILHSQKSLKPSLSKSTPSVSTKRDVKENMIDVRLSKTTEVKCPTIDRTECNAKGCTFKTVKHVYQGYFCMKHEEEIKRLRIFVDANTKDSRELVARISEQELRKVPHPLYQRDIDVLKTKIRREEAVFINDLFSKLKY